MTKNILLIDDDSDRLKLVKEALFDPELRNSDSPLFNSKNFDIYPKENDIDEFCKQVRTLNKTQLYFYIFEFVEKNNIDVIFTDLTFQNTDKIGDSSGEDLINSFLCDNLHQHMPIIAYSRKTKDQTKLAKNIRSKITYVPVGTDMNDAVELRRKFEQNINEELIADQIEEFRTKRFKFDLAVICALDKEYGAVKELIDAKGWTEINSLYEVAYWKNEEKETILKVVLTSMNNNMGMVEATLRTLDLINYAKPKLVAMTGIAGGSKKNGARLGDVCIAKTIDNWQSGKYKSGGRIELSPEIKEVPANIKNIIENHYVKDKKWSGFFNNIIKEKDYEKKIKSMINAEIALDKEYLKKIKRQEEKTNFEQLIRKKGRLPKFQFTDMMTGSSLVTDEEIIDKGMIERNRKVFFFDMEGYAVARVSHTKNYDWIVIKSIVDYGNHQKGDDWHEFACFASARVLQQLSFDILKKG